MISSRTLRILLLQKLPSHRICRKQSSDVHKARASTSTENRVSFAPLQSEANPIEIANSAACRNVFKSTSNPVHKHYESLQNETELLCPAGFRKLLPETDTFIFDADGVLWLGDVVIPGAPQLLDFLLKSNKQVIVLTNNATKSRAEYARKLANFGFNSRLDKHLIVNPAAVVADTLYRAGLSRNAKKVYLIGAKGLRDEMDDLGIPYFGHGLEPQEDSNDDAIMYDISLEEEPSKVGAVVVGYDKHFNYQKLMKAANYLQQRRCLFLATNEDETCPGPNPSIIIPDAGPIVAAVRCASGRQPITVGKPYTPAFDYIQKRWNIDPRRTIMIGDRTNTDVKFGRDHGMKTILVLSGCHQLEDIMHNRENDRFDMVPDYYATSLGGFVVPRGKA